MSSSFVRDPMRSETANMRGSAISSRAGSSRVGFSRVWVARSFGGMLASAIALTACTGEIDGGFGAPGAPGEGSSTPTESGLPGRGNDPFSAADPEVSSTAAAVKFRCEKPELKGMGQTAMRRLTRDEYMQTMSALLGSAVMESPAVQEVAAQIPQETTADIVKAFQNGQSFDHIEGLLLTAEAAAKVVSASAEASTRVFGACVDKADAACAGAFLDGFGRRVLKRPLDAERRASLLAAFMAEGGGKAGMSFVLARLLQSPEAVFHIEYPRQTCATTGAKAPTASFAYDDPTATFATDKPQAPQQVIGTSGWHVWTLPASAVPAAYTRLTIDLDVTAPAGKTLIVAVNLNDKPLLADTALGAGPQKLSADVTIPKGSATKVGVLFKNAGSGLTAAIGSLQLAGAGQTASNCTDEAAVGGKMSVDDWSVAARVAFALTGQGPDDALLDAAARGELRTTKQVRPHAERLVGTPAARRQLEAVLDAWLRLRTLPTPTETIAKAAGIEANGLAAEARQELIDYALFLVLDRNADAETLLTANIGFPRSERMAKLYGSAVATGKEPVDLPNGHGGLLLRVAPLLSGQHRTSPIGRGVYVRKRMMCDELPSPDFTIVTARTEALDAADPAKMSAREITTEITSPPGCMGCHAKINPIGFTLEQFGPLGQPRTVEVAYTLEGVEVGQHPIDSTTNEANLEEGGPATLADAVELNDALGEGAKVRSCIAERLYTHARLREANEADGCSLSDVEQALRSGATVKEAWMLAVVNDDLFARQAPEVTP
jgi:hypothetical protein